MTVQTTYEKFHQAPLPGLIYDIGNTDIDSFSAEVELPFGVFASRGTVPEDQAILGTAAAIGVTVRRAKENDYQGGAFDGGSYAIEETAGILRSGNIWTRFDAAGGTVGDAVTINASGQVVAAGTGTALTEITAKIEKAAIVSNGVAVGLVRIS